MFHLLYAYVRPLALGYETTLCYALVHFTTFVYLERKKSYMRIWQKVLTI